MEESWLAWIPESAPLMEPVLGGQRICPVAAIPPDVSPLPDLTHHAVRLALPVQFPAASVRFVRD
jgi:hypothetical protein